VGHLEETPSELEPVVEHSQALPSALVEVVVVLAVSTQATPMICSRECFM
jgi:hypothetical protein